MYSSSASHFQVSEGAMEMLGREDTALLLLARTQDSPNESLEDIMQNLCAGIEQNVYFGTIDRTTGPLNAEENPPNNSDGVFEDPVHDGAWIMVNCPMLAVRNEAMLEEARKLAGLDDDQLWRVVQAATDIKQIRESGGVNSTGRRL
jgi:hypothetical protein